MQVKANGKVDLWDGEADAMVELWAVDAMHAMSVHSERYSVEKPIKLKLVEKDKGKSE